MKLGEIDGSRESLALTTALFNLQGVKAYRLAIGNQDTCFTYAIQTDQKLVKCRVEQVQSFIAGFKAAIQVYR